MSELTPEEQKFANIFIQIKEVNKNFIVAIDEEKEDEALQTFADQQAELMEQLLAKEFEPQHLKFTQDLQDLLDECKAISAKLDTLK